MYPSKKHMLPSTGWAGCLQSCCNYIFLQSLYDGKQKVVDYILVNAGATGSLPYTHNDIANCLGMNRVTVSRIMQELRAEGLLNYTYRKVTVLDRDGLEEVLNNLE